MRAAHISTAMRVNGLSTGGATHANSPRPNGCGHDESASRRARLCAVASSGELLSKSVAQTRASHGIVLCSQSLAAEVCSTRVAKFSSVRSITQHSPRSHPISVKITGRATGTVSSRYLASPKSRQFSNTSRIRWSGGRKRIGQVRSALAARSYGRSHGLRVRRQSGAWLMAAAKRPAAHAVSVPA